MAKPNEEQGRLFENPPVWVDMWQGMPEYKHEDLTPWKTLNVHFRSREDYQAFFRLLGRTKAPSQGGSLWYPEEEIGRYANKLFVSAQDINPIYPVYIISKGRWKTRKTSRSFEKMNIPYRIVVEPQERDAYASVIAPEKILVLPFSNLGKGSIPARNWVWEHSLANGDLRHWIVDDNINGFYRYQDNLKVPAGDGSVFRIAEDFTDRYENIALSGPNYFMFVSRKEGGIPAFYLNTRVYSCILIKNDLPYRWRGRYNEDTDLSLRALKDGLCTVLFNAFLCGKEQTMTMKGGNTDELYKDDGRLKMAESLRDQHPDCVTITEKWGRPQHQVYYKGFKQRLILKPGVAITEGRDSYGMELQTVDAAK